MAQIKVKFTVVAEQTIDWPDDEMDDFTYDNLCANLDLDEASVSFDYDIIDVEKDGENHDF